MATPAASPRLDISASESVRMSSASLPLTSPLGSSALPCSATVVISSCRNETFNEWIDGAITCSSPHKHRCDHAAKSHDPGPKSHGPNIVNVCDEINSRRGWRPAMRRSRAGRSRNCCPRPACDAAPPSPSVNVSLTNTDHDSTKAFHQAEASPDGSCYCPKPALPNPSPRSATTPAASPFAGLMCWPP